MFDTCLLDSIFNVRSEKGPGVRRIMFNDPATVVFWEDGTKTVVKTTEGDRYVPYYGFLAALAKKIYGSNAKVQEMIRPWLPKEKETEGESFGSFLNRVDDEARKVEAAKDTDGDDELDHLFKLLGYLTFIKDAME